MADYQTVEITKTVPVTDRESLIAWIDQEILKKPPELGLVIKHIFDLIDEAGFKLTLPTVSR